MPASIAVSSGIKRLLAVKKIFHVLLRVLWLGASALASRVSAGPATIENCELRALLRTFGRSTAECSKPENFGRSP
jgi:hypothetical protein